MQVAHYAAVSVFPSIFTAPALHCVILIAFISTMIALKLLILLKLESFPARDELGMCETSLC